MKTLRRIQVNFEPAIAKFVEEKAKKKNISISKLTNDIVRDMMELDEDLYLSQLAEEAEKVDEGKPTIPSKDIWKILNT